MKNLMFIFSDKLIMKLNPPAKKSAFRYEFPKSGKDKLGFLVFILGGVFLLWYEVGHVFPTYYTEAYSDYITGHYIHYFMAGFLAINIYGNMYKLVTTDTSVGRFLFTSGSFLPEGWRYCSYCDLNLPPRSHHCKICDICILKRDHHCWFAGYCIGYHNQRYYVAMVTHMVLAAFYCNIFNLDFVVNVKGHLTLLTFLSYLGPHMGLLLGYHDFYTFFITTMTSVGTVLLFVFSWLLYIQINQLVYGQTKFESKRNIKRYNLGLRHSLIEVLGRRWYLVLLFPWIPSSLPGNGLQFRDKNS